MSWKSVFKDYRFLLTFIGALMQGGFSALFFGLAKIDIFKAIIFSFFGVLILFLIFGFIISRYSKSQPKKSTDEFKFVQEQMGIISGAATLLSSQFVPVKCMAQTRKNLSFMGILGSKWVIEPHVRSDFKKFLTRMEANNGTVRFLLINPYGEVFKRVKRLREGAISHESLRFYSELSKGFGCLKVKLYDQMPCFRLVFIDNRILVVSRYKVDKEGYLESKFGWQIPHLIIDQNTPWSLSQAFELFYEETWNTSMELEKCLNNQ